MAIVPVLVLLCFERKPVDLGASALLEDLAHDACALDHRGAHPNGILAADQQDAVENNLRARVTGYMVNCEAGSRLHLILPPAAFYNRIHWLVCFLLKPPEASLTHKGAGESKLARSKNRHYHDLRGLSSREGFRTSAQAHERRISVNLALTVCPT